ncbi:DUF4160 domain-containing protein [Brumimicrobium glaciale]|uniref:DUF4160 domain-containing protein n=1 Tax=Brumimicrobium glaciale TaxID=200475 RepID=UPI0013EB2EA1|nr:DUF4160 domain-containing protein [Brumimicrobium glaciale]
MNGYRFYFYSNENGEPVHIHILKAEGNAKYWLNPLEEAYSYGFTLQQRKDILKLLSKHKETLIKAWYEYFK